MSEGKFSGVSSQIVAAKGVMQKILTENMLRMQERTKDKNYIKAVAEANEAAKRLDYTKIKNLQQKDREEATKLYKSSLEELWDCFDDNKDGVLSLEENGKLMKIYIEVSIEVTQQRIQENFTQGVMNTIPDGPRKAQLMEVARNVVSKVPSWIKKWTTKHFNTDDFRGRTLKTMDVNKDGKVEKEEFTSKFFEAVQDGIDYSEMSQVMKKQLFDCYTPLLREQVCCGVHGTNGIGAHRKCRPISFPCCR